MHVTHGITLTPELREKLESTRCKRDPEFGDVYQSAIRKHNKPDADILITLLVTYNHAARCLRVFYSLNTTTGSRVYYYGTTETKQKHPIITDSLWCRPPIDAGVSFGDLFSTQYLRQVRNAALQSILDRYTWE